MEQAHELISNSQIQRAILDNSGVFPIELGGRYQTLVVATWSGGSVTFQQLGPDGSTFLNVDNAYTANGGGTYDLPPGNYKFVIVTSTNVTMQVSRVPGD